jgi:hypothetical protein
MRDNNILVRHIKPSGEEAGDSLGELAGTAALLRHLVANGGDGPAGSAIAHAAFPVHNDSGSL